MRTLIRLPCEDTDQTDLIRVFAERTRKSCRKFCALAAVYLELSVLMLYLVNFTKSRLFKYTEHSDIFHISAQNIACGFSLGPPRRGGFNEYPQSMFF